MTLEFKLPDVGEGVAEGELVKWLVREGETVSEDQPLVEVMTDKATVEIPSPRSGTILKIMAQEGDMVPVGAVMVVIGEEGEALESKAQKKQGPTVLESPESAEARTPSTQTRKATKVLATPATRKLARELGVNLSQIQGTGAKGKVTKADVERHAEAEEKPSTTASTSELEERVPLRGIRRLVAERMVASKSTIPHFTYVDEVDMTEIVLIRKKAKPRAEEQGVKLTYLPFILKALVAALRDFPLMNATLDEEQEEITIKRYYHIGIATDTDDGLVVPVIRDVDQKSLFALAKELGEMSDKARRGKLALPDLQGGTFTLTSTGNIGGLFATPIINLPEVAILGVHQIQRRPVVRNETDIVIRDIMLLSLSLDHRVIDGAVGAKFMNRLIRCLEDPHHLFIENLLFL